MSFIMSQEQLRSKITREIIPASGSSLVLYYTMCKKEAITVSVLHHDRLLILDQTNETIYYTNEIVNTPFKSENKVPKPKNYCPRIDRCVIKRYQEDGKPTNILSIEFNVKQEGKEKYVNWKFSMKNEDLPRQWENLIKQTKEKRIKQEQKRRQQQKEKQKQKQKEKQKEKERKRQQQLKKREKEQQERKREQQQRERKRQEQSYRKNQLKLQMQRQLQLENQKQKQVEKTKRQEEEKTDWNLQFTKNRSKQTIINFSQYCYRQFHSLKIDKIKERFMEENTVIVKFSGIIMYFTQPYSEVSQLLTEQFLNYQYIIESCGSNSCIGVPLSCLIQERGVLCMAKARFPENVKLIFKNQLKQNNPFATTIIGLFKQLQSHTKINYEVIIHSCKILNLSILYDFNNGFPRIFIDELEHLLPHYPSPQSKNHPSLTQNSLKQLVHPSLILNNFNRIIVPSIKGISKAQQDKTQEELYFYVEQSLNQLTQLLIQQDIMICSYTDLEEIMNFYGLNISLIHSLHYLIELRTKKQEVRYLKSVLLSIKCAIIVFEQKIIPLLNQSQQVQMQIFGIYKMYCEGGSSINEHAWKQLHHAYKSKYSSHLFQNEVLGGIFLSSLMQLAKGSYTIQKLQKQKQLLKQKEIIKQGFIKRIEGGQIKTYNCHLNEQQYKQQKIIMSLCQNIKVNNMNKIKQQRIFKEVQNIDQVLTHNNKMKFVTYLTKYISPFQSEYPQLQEYIYEYVYIEPPTIYTENITINYLKYYKEQILKVRLLQNEQKSRTMCEKYLQFLLNIQTNFQFWLGKENPFLCSIIEEQAQLEFVFSQNLNKYIQSIRRSLMIWEKGYGITNYAVSKKNRKIGSMLFKHGFNKQALEYLNKSKDILEDNIDKYLQEYTVLLSQIAELQLSQNNLGESRILAELSNDKVQKIKQLKRVKKQAYVMKNEQMISILYNNCRMLFRIYQIEKNIDKLRELAHDMNRILYYQKNPIIFDNVLKMCIISAFYAIGLQNQGHTTLLTIRSYISTAFPKQKQDQSMKLQNHRKKVKKIAGQHIISEIVKQKLCKMVDNKNKEEQMITSKQFQSVVECGGGSTELEAIISQVLDYVYSKMSI